MMITAYGRHRRLKKIVLASLVIILFVQFVFFLTITLNRQRRIYLPESAVCESQKMGDLQDEGIDLRKHNRTLENDHFNDSRTSNIKIWKTDTVKSGRKLSTSPKVAFTRSIRLRRPFVSRSAGKITTIKSNLIIAKTNPTTLRTELGALKINTALSTVKHNPSTGATFTTRHSTNKARHSITGTNSSQLALEQKIPHGKNSKLSTIRNMLAPSLKLTLKKTRPKDKQPPLPASQSVVKIKIKVKVKIQPAANSKLAQSNSKNISPSTTAKIEKLPKPMRTKASPLLKKQPVKQPLDDTTTVTSKDKITAASTSDFTWTKLTTFLSIFSSYHDKRYLKTVRGFFQNSLVVIGYELGDFTKRNVYCVVIMEDNERVMVKQPAMRIILSELWKKAQNKYRAVMYRCNLTRRETPRYVTLIGRPTFTLLYSIPLAYFTPVVDPQSPVPIHEFGVCYETPLYGNKYDQGIMDSIEMNKLLGATWFTIYVYEAHQKALEILKYYSQELKILDAVFNWGKNMPSPVYNRGLLAGVHDCVYRNMFKVRYLVLCDLDEFIVPMQSLNWHDLLSKMDEPKFAYFIFQHIGFHRNHTKGQELLHCPGRDNLTYKMPRYFATHNRSVSVIAKNRQCKSIAKPKYSIVVHVHHSRVMLLGYSRYIVPTNLALMKHFRDKDDPRYINYETTLDYSMDRFKPALFAAIEKHYCGNIKNVAG